MSTSCSSTSGLSPFEIACGVARAAESKKSQQVTVLETAQVTTVSDYFVICTGESTIQIRAIADTVESELKARGVVPIALQKGKTPDWVVLDFGDVVVHMMLPETRERYDLEGFWSHATPVDPVRWQQAEVS